MSTSVLDGVKCKRCGMDWHPPALCWAYRWLDVETIESICAKIYNQAFDFEQWDRRTHGVGYSLNVWEGEGGR